MPVKQALLRYTPHQFIHWAKFLVNPDYRHKTRELARLKSVPRYQRAFTNILGKPLEAVDSASLIFMYKEIFESEIYRFRARNENPLIIDCGSNIGLSVLYFKQLYPRSRVIAFEADDEVFAVLERNIERLGCQNVEMHCRAVWSTETSLGFRHEGADGGRLAQGHDPADKIVQTVRLRDYLGERVDFLKIDIEGAETEVLLDCKDRLPNVENIFLEYHSFADRPQTLHLITEILANAGFRLHVQPVLISAQPFVSRTIDGGYDMQLNVFGFRD